jgi:antitoxin (DNA-binding transcriptional repressor) of toxin-antitoxin stability system
MRRVGIEVLRDQLTEYVQAAEAGETVLVTDSDRVVAELVPPRGAGKETEQEILRRGYREGWLTPARGDREEFVAWLRTRQPDPNDPGIPFGQLMADLAGDREDR